MEKPVRPEETRPAEGPVTGAERSSRTRSMVGAAQVSITHLVCRRIAMVHEDSAAEERSPTSLRGPWQPTRLLALLCLLVPAAMVFGLLWVIWTRTAAVPYWDEWETVLLEQHFKQGTLSFDEIVSLHANAHRIILPRLIALALINVTNWNRQIEMTFDVGVAVAAACLLFWCVRETLGSLAVSLALLAPLSLLFFSFAQFGNWFTPFQIADILAVFGVACCVRGLAKAAVSRASFALALAGACIGSLALLNGLLTWVAFLPGAARSGLRKSLAWIGSAAVVWFLYFQHFPFSPTRPGIRQDIAYSLAYLGAPVGYPSIGHAQLAGALSILLLLGNVLWYWAHHKNLASVWRIAPWLQVALFALGCTQATAQGRLGGGPDEAMSSRYEAFSTLWWIALLVVVGLNVTELLPSLRLGGGLASVSARGMAGLGAVGLNLLAVLTVTASLVPVNLVGLQQALQWQDVQRQNQAAIVAYQTAPDSCLTLYYPSAQEVRVRAQFLDQQRLGIFGATDLSRYLAESPTAECQKPYHFINETGGQAGGRLTSSAPIP